MPTPPTDAAEVGQLVVRLGLADGDLVRECLIELDDRAAPALDMVRLMERKRYLSPWQGSKLLKGETDGYVLGGYRLLYKIASGSFGRVYRGDDPRTGQVVAIKVLRSKWMADAQKVELFMREGKVGLSMRHPHIVQILAVSQDTATRQYFIAMEFVEGGTLRDILQIRKKLAPDEALRILEECADGLAYSAGRGLTHRDIKPTNILVASTGEAKLVDFGLAQFSDTPAAGGKADKGEVSVDRTVDYAGLEKATGVKPGDVRSDIYFLGAVLFECVAGEPVMPATRDRRAKMEARRYQDVEEHLRRNGPALGVPPAAMKLLGRMLAFDPGGRLQTAAQLVEAVRTARAELSGAAPAGRGPSGPKTLFVVEANAKIQDAFREKFKKFGYRVLISLDPGQALKRYQSAPYHALVVDAGTAGREGVDAFRRVVREAGTMSLGLGAVLILNEDQAGWAKEAATDGAGVLVRPVTMKQVLKTIRQLGGDTDPVPTGTDEHGPG